MAVATVPDAYILPLRLSGCGRPRRLASVGERLKDDRREDWGEFGSVVVAD